MSEVIKIENKMNLSVSVTTTLSNNSTSTGEFKVGEGVQKLVYLDKGKDGVVSGTVTKIKYNMGENSLEINILGLVIADNETGKEVEIPIDLIKLCGEPEIKVEGNLASALASIEDGQVISVPVIKEAVDVEFNKCVTVKGAQSNTSIKERLNDSVEGETVLRSIIVKDNGNVDLIGVAVTGVVDLSGAGEEVLLRNSKVVNIIPTAAKTYPVTMKTGTEPIKLEVKDCYFGKSAQNEENAKFTLYNYFELNRPLADGTVFENCYFAKDACTHNLINIYDVEDGATITIKNCIFENSENAVRIGTKGDAHCTINIVDCTYLETSDDEYAGLFFIQPYSSKTTDMSHVVINVSGTVNKSGVKQLWYKFTNKSDMQFDEYNVPTIIVNGKVELAPKKK